MICADSVSSCARLRAGTPTSPAMTSYGCIGSSKYCSSQNENRLAQVQGGGTDERISGREINLEVTPGRGQGGLCLTDGARSAAPGRTARGLGRYTTVRTSPW